MNIAFASEREREMILLRKKKIKSIFLYNLQEIERKRTIKEQQRNQFENSYQSLASQALESLNQENRKKNIKRELEKNMLRDSYEKQIRDRYQKGKAEKLRDKEYLDRQRAYSEYEQARRMADVQKMFDRMSYLGIPTIGHKRIRTEPFQHQGQHLNPQPSSLHLPQINQNHESKLSLPASLTKNKLDYVSVQAIQKQKRNTPKNLSRF